MRQFELEMTVQQVEDEGTIEQKRRTKAALREAEIPGVDPGAAAALIFPPGKTRRGEAPIQDPMASWHQSVNNKYGRGWSNCLSASDPRRSRKHRSRNH